MDSFVPHERASPTITTQLLASGLDYPNLEDASSGLIHQWNVLLLLLLLGLQIFSPGKLL